MTAHEKRLERILILRTIIANGDDLQAVEIADRASSECDHDALEALPPISRRAVGQKLESMWRDGLVVGYEAVKNDPLTWKVTAKGWSLAESIGLVGSSVCPTCGGSGRQPALSPEDQL